LTAVARATASVQHFAMVTIRGLITRTWRTHYGHSSSAGSLGSKTR
jgi:hypothetical protein